MDGLLNQTPPIPLHALGAMLAIMLGAAQLSMKKGGAVHMLLGRVWVGQMLVVAGSSFFIHEIRLWGAYSPIHQLRNMDKYSHPPYADKHSLTRKR